MLSPDEIRKIIMEHGQEERVREVCERLGALSNENVMDGDRELLEAAAKAAGYELQRSRLDDPLWRDMLLKVRDPAHDGRGVGWNPLTDDGDALRLAVKLLIEINPTIHDKPTVSVYGNKAGRMVAAHEPRTPDIMAATRRAIVRAAAAMAPKEK